MPRILICANSFPPQIGGLATYSSQLALHLEKLKFNVTVITPAAPPHAACEVEQLNNVLRYSSKFDLYKKCLIE